jgi:hypothetical protein
LKCNTEDISYLGQYTYENTVNNKESKVFVYITFIKENINIKIGQVLKEDGSSEDNHSGFEWITPEDFLEKNNNKEGSESYISNNSKILKFQKRIMVRIKRLLSKKA